MTKIDITSTAVEKGLDIAKEFLGKLIMPTVSEVGLLAKDKISAWRFKNQIKTLVKTQEYCKKYNIQPKTISFKLVCPLLEYSSLEEDEKLQDKWAMLLGNLVDSEQNIENHVFPYLLSQISVNEYQALEKDYKINAKEKLSIYNDYTEHKEILQSEQSKLEKKIEELEALISHYESNNQEKSQNKIYKNNDNRKDLSQAKSELEAIKSRGRKYQKDIESPFYFFFEDVKEFEIANLVRLGIIRLIQENYSTPQKLMIPRNTPIKGIGNLPYVHDLDIEIRTNEKYIFTELGKLFIEACNPKGMSSNSKEFKFDTQS